MENVYNVHNLDYFKFNLIEMPLMQVKLYLII